MPMLEVKSRDYQAKIEAAIAEAIFNASRTEDGGTAVLLSGEIVQACLNTIALMAGTSEVSATLKRTRDFADECSKAIRLRTAAVREQRAEGAMDWMTIVNADERH